MQSKQPEALRLADLLDNQGYEYDLDAAAELRRLYEANQEMINKLKAVQAHIRFGQDLEQADLLLSAAITKAMTIAPTTTSELSFKPVTFIVILESQEEVDNAVDACIKENT